MTRRSEGGRGSDGVGRLSRRRLLAGLGGVGAIGAASGAGTFAFLTDAAVLPNNTIGSGEVALDVSCADHDGTANCTVSDGLVSVGIEGLDRGSYGAESFGISVLTNPVRLWFATVCPDPDLAAFDPLGDALSVTLVVENGGSSTLFSGSLSALREAFVDGLRIDDLDGEACLSPDGTLDVTLYWELPIDAPSVAAGRETGFEFRLYTEQCRHVSEDDAVGSNPFAGLGPCEEPPEPCPECEFGGKADDVEGQISISDPNDTATWLSIDEGPLAGEAFLFVTDVEYKDGDEAVGVRFDLVDADGNAFGDLCEVRLKGGPTTERYQIEPPSPDTGAVLLAPDGSGNSGRREISNIEIDICVDEERGSDEPDDSGDPDEPDCIECVDGEPTLLGLTFRYLGSEPAQITGVPEQGGASTGLLFEGTVAPDERFTLDGTNLDRPGNRDDWIGPNVEIVVDGGTTVSIHTSCSVALGVGDAFGSDGAGGPLYELVAGTSTDGEPLCDSEDRS